MSTGNQPLFVTEGINHLKKIEQAHREYQQDMLRVTDELLYGIQLSPLDYFVTEYAGKTLKAYQASLLRDLEKGVSFHAVHADTAERTAAYLVNHEYIPAPYAQFRSAENLLKWRVNDGH